MRILIFILIISTMKLWGCKTDLNVTKIDTESGIKLVYKPKDTAFSGSEIVIIPRHPEFEIEEKTGISIIDYLAKKLPKKEITARLDTTIEFVDCGQRFEKIFCPKCGKEITMDFWQESMDKAYESNFQDMTIQTNCCRTKTNLNSLKYQSDCGFAKSSITINDFQNELTESELLGELNKISGIDFKIIYRHI